MVAALVQHGGESQPEGLASDAVRQKWLGRIPWWYSPWGHLAFPAMSGLSLIGMAVHLVHQPKLWELATVPLVLLWSNAIEWRVHKSVLHRRFWPLEDLYYKHTPNHHRVYVTTDMVIRTPRELRFVLLPFWAVIALFLLTAPITLGLWLVGLHNVSALFVATSMSYVLSYEWLHLAYHLPPGSLPGRLVGGLRRHHATHHDPALMQAWNFNVTVPLWDWLRGTIHKG